MKNWFESLSQAQKLLVTVIAVSFFGTMICCADSWFDNFIGVLIFSSVATVVFTFLGIVTYAIWQKYWPERLQKVIDNIFSEED